MHNWAHSNPRTYHSNTLSNQNNLTQDHIHVTAQHVWTIIWLMGCAARWCKNFQMIQSRAYRYINQHCLLNKHDSVQSKASGNRAQTYVVMRSRVVSDRNSAMISSRSFCGMSPCIADTVKLLLIFSVSQSTYPMYTNKSDLMQVCVTAAAATVYETTFMQHATSTCIPNLLHLHPHKSTKNLKNYKYNSNTHMSSHDMLLNEQNLRFVLQKMTAWVMVSVS